VKLKVVATLCALAMGSVGTAFADSSLSQQVSDLQAQVSKLQAQVSGMGGTSTAGAGSAVIGFYSPLTWQLLDNYTGVNTEMSILKARQQNNLASQGVYVGGFAKGGVNYQHTNTDGAFTNANNKATGNQGSFLGLNQANVDVIGNLNDWASAYVQTGATDIGSGSSDNLDIQKAYLLVGNLNNSPVYATFGKKDIDFGNFTSVNFYTAPLNRSVFEASGNELAVGYAQYGFNGTLSVTNGGDNGTNLYTQNNGQINNFAANVAYAASNNGVNWNVGAGYLNGANTVVDGANSKARSGAWDVNGSVGVNNFNVVAEYTVDTDALASGLPHLAAWDLGANYLFPVLGRNSVVSADYSAIHGTNNLAQTQTFSQYVLGFRTEVYTNVWGGIEYAYNDGIYGYDSNLVGPPNLVGVANDSIRNSTVRLDLTAGF